MFWKDCHKRQYSLISKMRNYCSGKFEIDDPVVILLTITNLEDEERI